MSALHPTTPRFKANARAALDNPNIQSAMGAMGGGMLAALSAEPWAASQWMRGAACVLLGPTLKSRTDRLLDTRAFLLSD